MDLICSPNSIHQKPLAIFSLISISRGGYSAPPKRTPSRPPVGENCSGSVDPGTTRQTPVRRKSIFPEFRPRNSWGTESPAILGRNYPRRQPLKALLPSRDRAAPEPKRFFRTTLGAHFGVGGWGNFLSSGGPDSQTRCRPKSRIFMNIAIALSPASVSA